MINKLTFLEKDTCSKTAVRMKVNRKFLISKRRNLSRFQKTIVKMWRILSEQVLEERTLLVRMNDGTQVPVSRSRLRKTPTQSTRFHWKKLSPYVPLRPKAQTFQYQSQSKPVLSGKLLYYVAKYTKSRLFKLVANKRKMIKFVNGDTVQLKDWRRLDARIPNEFKSQMNWIVFPGKEKRPASTVHCRQQMLMTRWNIKWLFKWWKWEKTFRYFWLEARAHDGTPTWSDVVLLIKLMQLSESWSKLECVVRECVRWRLGWRIACLSDDVDNVAFFQWQIVVRIDNHKRVSVTQSGSVVCFGWRRHVETFHTVAHQRSQLLSLDFRADLLMLSHIVRVHEHVRILRGGQDGTLLGAINACVCR